ncbi:MAG: hypothetical protein KME05_23890 [Gloeocapsa sp. UFS-A4-WI-NPMV-4B04]|nr:hypothetical protein [Gloeocapsa sp. UFS-A4-WI-NPMV-4B04]
MRSTRVNILKLNAKGLLVPAVTQLLSGYYPIPPFSRELPSGLAPSSRLHPI